MEFWLAAVLFVLSLVGLIASALLLRKKRALRVLLLVVFSLTSLILAGYLGATLLLVNAAIHH